MARSFSGRALRDARIAAGLRPERVADKIGRSVHSVALYESDRVTPPLPVALALADVVGCTLEDLLAEEAACVA